MLQFLWNILVGKTTTKLSSSINVKPSYNYLVVAALQEELNAFTSLTSKIRKVKSLETGTDELSYKMDNSANEIKILSYATTKMGMSYNAAAVMRIIQIHQPIYTFFIGTCAGLYPEKQKCGDVLVPHRIFNYESGKHSEDGRFEPDHTCYETDDDMRRYAEIIKNKVSRQYSVITDEDFYSGSAIVDNASKKAEIIKASPRKVTGLDMEAFSIACINNILKEEGKKLAVVKAIMDFGESKLASEKSENKTLAKTNSAKFTLELIRYIEMNIIVDDKPIKIG